MAYPSENRGLSFMDEIQKVLNSIKQLYLLNKLDNAIFFCDELLKHDKNNYEAQLYKALSLVKKKAFLEAKTQLSKLVKRKSKDVRPVMGLAFLSLEEGDVGGANKQFLKVIKKDPEQAEAHFYYALTLERLNKQKEARKAVDLAIGKFGLLPGLLYVSALLFRREKRYGDAIDALLNVGDTIEPEYVANKHFELMQNYNAIKAYDKAFESLQLAQNKRIEFMSRQGISCDKNDYLRLVGLYEVFLDSKPEVSRLPCDFETADKEICFFVGFPRSGTTLAQHMMQSHPDVETLDEKPLVADLFETFLNEHGSSLNALNSLTGEDIERYRALYFLSVEKELKGLDYRLLVDKMPLNLIHVPFVTTVFPEAKILLALRHPCDCVLSCMMQNFDFNSAMMNFTNLEDGSSLYSRVFSIFEKALALYKPSVHSFRYEDVVENTQSTLKDICSFLNLKWSEDMMDYRDDLQKKELISTPSFRQVVEPINQNAKYRWVHYQNHFDKAMPFLEPFIKKHGYIEGGDI